MASWHTLAGCLAGLGCDSASESDDGLFEGPEAPALLAPPPGHIRAAATWLKSEVTKVTEIAKAGSSAGLAAALTRTLPALLNWEAVQSGSSELFGEAAWANSGRYASEIGDMSEHVKLLKVAGAPGGASVLAAPTSARGSQEPLQLSISWPIVLWMRLHPQLGFHANLNLLLSMLCICDRRGWLLALEDGEWAYAASKAAGGWRHYFKPLPGEAVFALALCKIEDVRTHARHQEFVVPTSIDLAEHIAPAPAFQAKAAELQRSIRYTSDIRREVREVRRSVGLPRRYAAFMIRRGDKVQGHTQEATRIDGSDYLHMLLESDLSWGDRAIFVMTDDYTAVEEVHAAVDELGVGADVFTLCEPWERGFSLSHSVSSETKASGAYVLDKLSPQQKRDHVIRLLSGQDICAAADVFVSTFSANTARYIALERTDGLASCISLDTDWEPL